MNYIPKNINSWDRLQQLIRAADERVSHNPKAKVRVLIFSPWNESSTKFKGYDARVNLFEVPEVMQVLNETYEQDLKLNVVPTLVNLQLVDDQVKMVVVDNAAAIQHELTSGG
jgi:hypothetical protein